MGNRQETLNVRQHREDAASGSPNGSSKPPLRPDQRKFRAILVLVFLVLLAGLALLPLGPPTSFLGLQTCAFKGATGLPCPLCGGTRAAQAVLRGDLVRASYLNPAALPVVVALVAAAIMLAIEAMRGRAVVTWGAVLRRLQPLLPVLALLFCLYWIVHLVSAVRASKAELVDLRNPVARSICQRFSDPKR
jgi:hypothetical protein